MIRGIDWQTLRQQKQHLFEILDDENSSITAEQHISIEGIVTLLDNIQDYAVDILGVDEDAVFGDLDEAETIKEL